MNDDEGYIERYVRAELTAMEMAAADARSAADPAFAQAVADMRLLMELAHRARDLRVDDAVRAARARQEAGGRATPAIVVWAVAAVVMLLAVVGVFYWLQPVDAMSYFEAPPSTDAILGGGGMEPAFQRYDAGDYEGALLLLGAIPRTDTADWEEAQYYGAASLMALGHGDLAIPMWEGFLQRNADRSTQYQEARWYLALCYADVGRKADALAILQEIDASVLATHRVQARELMADLE
jgi:tetratricopeptide (TPR) repeat protein